MVITLCVVSFYIAASGLGIYLIRKEIVQDSIPFLIVEVVLNGFWIGIIAYLFYKDNSAVLKEKEKLL